MRFALRLLPLSVACVAAFASLPAHRQVFKCRGADGKMVYTDGACASGQTSQQIEQAKTGAEIAQERERTQEALQRKQQAGQEAREQAVASHSARQTSGFSDPPAANHPASSAECVAAQKDLEFASSRIYRTPEERRGSLNALIARSNAACGSHTTLVQEPARGVRRERTYRY